MKKESMFIIGASSLAISLIMGMFLSDVPLISFFEGVFVGISLAMNISFLIRYRLERNSVYEGNNGKKELDGDKLGEK